MQFLKTLFWVLVAVVLAVFAFNNWKMVDVDLWQNLTISIFLPLLVIGAFLVGVLLIWLPHRASRWNWSRKLDATERKLAGEREQRARLEGQLVDERSRAETTVARPMVGEPLMVEPGETVVVSPARDADGRPIARPDDRI